MTTTLRARFDGKVLIPEEPVDLPTDRVLEVRVEDGVEQDASVGLVKLLEELDKLPYDPDSPSDAAAQHDHYLYGTPKRENP
jgi:hypothetical protein